MKTLLLLFIGILSTTIYAQDGSPDLSFGENGLAITNYGESFLSVNSFDKGNSGRIAISGIQLIADIQVNLINVYTNNGSIDTSFGQNGTVTSEQSEFNNVKVLNDNTILYTTELNGRFSIGKLNTNGTATTEFGTNGILQPFPNTVNPQNFQINSEESIFSTGAYESGNEEVYAIRKFMPNGSRDNDFGNNGEVIMPSNLEIGSLDGELHFFLNGKIVLHYLNTVTDNDETTTSHTLIRLNSTGEIDTSYGINGILPFNMEENFSASVTFFEDGGFLAYHAYYVGQETSISQIIARFNPDGTRDTTFGTDGLLSGKRLCFIQKNGRFILDSAQYTDQSGIRPLLGRYHADGNFDPSFSFQFNYPLVSSYGLMQTEQGEILLAASDFGESGPDNYLILAQYNNSPLSIEENTFTEFKVYPNPSEGIFTLLINKLQSENSNYKITDISGKIIKTGFLSSEANKLDLSEFAAGIYIFQVGHNTLFLIKK